MRQTVWLKRSILAAAVISTGGILLNGQEVEKLQASELSSIRASAAKAAAVSLWAVTQDFTGSFDSVREYSEKVKQEAINQKVTSSIAPKPGAASQTSQPQGILILQEDPTGKSQFRMSVGFTVPGKVEARPPLKVEQITYPRAVRHTHVGKFPELASVYHGMNDARAVKFPVVLRLLDDPERVPLQFVRTELIAPVK